MNITQADILDVISFEWNYANTAENHMRAWSDMLERISTLRMVARKGGASQTFIDQLNTLWDVALERMCMH